MSERNYQLLIFVKGSKMGSELFKNIYLDIFIKLLINIIFWQFHIFLEGTVFIRH